MAATGPSETVAALREAGAPPALVGALDALARNEGRTLDGYLVSIGQEVALEGTRATCRCHFLARDGNNRPLVEDLVAWLVAQAVDYCIPRSRIAEALEAAVRDRNTEQLGRLTTEARGLFTKLKTSGEGGETLLYLLLEIVLGLPQLLCKMPLKTDADMHVHGTDGIHGRVLEDGTLALYWGESKLYKSANDAVYNCLKDLAPYLTDTGRGEAARDVLLLRDHVNLGDPALSAALKRYFTAGTVERTQVEVRGAALIGFSLDNYPVPHGEDGTTVSTEVAELVERWYDRVRSNVSNLNINEFTLEVFCVPFPDVQSFRDELRDQLGLG